MSKHNWSPLETAVYLRLNYQELLDREAEKGQSGEWPWVLTDAARSWREGFLTAVELLEEECNITWNYDHYDPAP